MIKKLNEGKRIKNYISLTIVYLVSQWFLLVASGRWWDDWVYANKNWDYLFEVFLQSSLPLHAFINAGLWLFPDGFNRILTFFLFYGGSIILYEILGKIECFKGDAKLWITLLYIVIPINDARITWICFGYSLGLFMYWLAFYFAVISREKQGAKGIVYHVLSLIFLLISFDTESIMMLTVLILLYFYYEDLRVDFHWNEVLLNIKKMCRSIIMHIDYLIAPVAWYILDKVLFPGYGIYGGHSYISWDTLPSVILNTPKNAAITFNGIISSYLSLIKESWIAQYSIVIIVGLYVLKMIIDYRKGRKRTEKDNAYVKYIIMIILGAGIFFLGFFPYAVKHNSAIDNIYVRGRDSLLLGIGTAIVMYYVIKLCLKEHIAKIIMISLICLGIIHFNYIYLDWQECYYQQVQLQHEIKQNEEIRSNDTFLIMYDGDIICSNYYQTNGNSWAATGEETRYYMPGTHALSGLIEMTDDTWSLNAYGMSDYDYGEKVIDGIIFVDYADIGRKTILKQKLNELFHKADFDDWIDEIKNIKFVKITREESDTILNLYKNKELRNKTIYDMYY